MYVCVGLWSFLRQSWNSCVINMSLNNQTNQPITSDFSLIYIYFFFFWSYVIPLWKIFMPAVYQSMLSVSVLQEVSLFTWLIYNVLFCFDFLKKIFATKILSKTRCSVLPPVSWIHILTLRTVLHSPTKARLSHIPGMCDLDHIALGEMQTPLMHFLSKNSSLFELQQLKTIEIPKEITGG